MLILSVALALQTAQPAPPRWDAALRWTVGAADSGPVFAAILSAAVDRSGTAYVLDSVDPFVHEISAAGRLVRSFGALGDGPGEFRQPRRLGWAGERLVVADGAHDRITLLDRRGRAGGTTSLTAKPAPPASGLRALARAPDGAQLAMGVSADADRAKGLVSHTPLFRTTADGTAITHTVARVVTRRQTMFLPLRVNGLAGKGWFRQPFGDDAVWDVAPDGAGVVIVDRAAAAGPLATHFTVVRLSPVGDTIFSTRVPYTPRALDDATLAHWLDPKRYAPANKSVRVEIDPGEIRRALYRPRYFPPAESVGVGRNGWVWVQRTSSVADKTTELLVLSERGAVLGRVTVPSGERFLQATDSLLWTTGRGADDEPTLSLYRFK